MLTLDRDHAVAHDMHMMFDGVATTRGGSGSAPVDGDRACGHEATGRWLLAIVPLVLALLAGGALVHGGLATSAEHVAGTHMAVPAATPVAATAPAIVTPPPVAVVPVAAADAPPAGRSTSVQRRAATASNTAPPALAVRRKAAPSEKEGEQRTVIAASPARSGCREDDPRDDCIYGDVIAADGRLRAAYDNAVDAGVPAASLVPITRSWRQARALAQDYPDETIRRYGALVRELGDARTRDGR